MKIEELIETASPGMTSVQSIGNIEAVAFPSHVRLYKRCDDKSKCIAKIRRKKNDGWRFTPTKNWSGEKLPHFGNVVNTKLPMRGRKTIHKNISGLLKTWGVRYDSLSIKEKGE